MLRNAAGQSPLLRVLVKHRTPITLSVRSGKRCRSTVSPDEVSHFNALASSWWDPHGPSRLLHLMNPLRHTFIQTCRSSQRDVAVATEDTVEYLDVGCGGGIFAESAARLSTTRSVTAIDPTPEVLAVAKEHARRDPALSGTDSKLRYLETSIEDLKTQIAPEKQYDVVTLFEVLEHVETPSAFLEHLADHVKPGGWLILSTIARTWTSWVVTKLVAEDVARIVPRGTHDWSKYVNETEVREWFQKGKQQGKWESPRAMGVIYVPGIGWREVRGSEDWGNYFFGIRKRPSSPN